MKIDLHCHTIETKDGDAGRNISKEDFKRILILNDVKMCAITNHNYFDTFQFNDFKNYCGDDIVLLPGIELDVIGNKSGDEVRGHVIVISDPDKIEDFEKIIMSLNIADPESFTLNIDSFVSTFGQLRGCLYLIHYRKKPQLSRDDIEFIKNNINDFVALEPSNTRKAGIILLNDGENCWIGSDVKDWNNYPGDKLPTCRFQIGSFKNLLLLLKKDRGSVLANGFLDYKKNDLISLNVFDDLDFEFQSFNDIHVIFGGKATAKTSILNKLKEYYIAKSKIVSEYFVQFKNEDFSNIVDKPPLQENIDEFDNFSCQTHIDRIKKWSWNNIPTLNDYFKYYKTSESCNAAEKYKIIESSFTENIDLVSFNKKKAKYFDNMAQIDAFINNSDFDVLDNEDKKNFNLLVEQIRTKLRERYYKESFDLYGLHLEDWTIKKLKNKLSCSNAISEKPNNCGFNDFVNKYTNLEDDVENIKKCLNNETTIDRRKLGTIKFKGDVNVKTYFGIKIQNETKHKEAGWGKRKFLTAGMVKTTVDKFRTNLNAIFKEKYDTEEIMTNVNCFNNYNNEKNISSLLDFLNYVNLLETVNNKDFLPSNGVMATLLVFNALNDDSDVIILDEPDGGMGEDFINESLIPLIKKRSDENKIIYIATHDPNLIIGLHPFTCIYREEINDGIYETFIGSSFDEYLVNVLDGNKKVDFAKVCLDKCEGGINAFSERKNAYGNE